MQGDDQSPRSTRRSFLAAGTAAAVGIGLTGRASRGQAAETLAMSGGKKTVTVPDEQHREAYRWPRYGDAEQQACSEVLKIADSHPYRDLPLFEKEWKDYHRVPYCKSHMNGTSALASMYFAMDFPPGSEIMVPSYTFFATILPMRLFGYVPVFCDVNPRTVNLDVENLKRRLTAKTKAIVPVHWWGLPCEMDAIGAFAREHGLMVCEDAAHAHGAKYQGQPIGTIGEMAIFSFQATKPLPTLEGGMGMYQKREHFERADVFGHYEDAGGLPADSPYRKYKSSGLGLKFRMHPMSAAIGRAQLRGLDQRNAMIAAQVRRLNDRLMQLAGLSEPACPKGVDRVYYNNNVLFLDEAKAGFTRAALLKALRAEGVHAEGNNYPLQHECAVYAEAKWWHHAPQMPGTLAGAKQVLATTVKLPLFSMEVPELIEQYGAAFEKVWAHKTELAKA